jgi:hypothetical protein
MLRQRTARTWDWFERWGWRLLLLPVIFGIRGTVRWVAAGVLIASLVGDIGFELVRWVARRKP